MGAVRAARTAGKKPPTRPMKAPTPTDKRRMKAEGLKENVTSCQVAKFIIEKDTPDMARLARAPKQAPPKASTIDSTMKATSTAKRENPSACKVPISRERWLTAAYIVIVAPIMAPAEKKSAMMAPRAVMKMLVPSDCFS